MGMGKMDKGTAEPRTNRTTVRTLVSASSDELTQAGQSRLGREYENTRLEDCFVYHWFDTPDGQVIPGVWDLRNNWRGYLGNTNLRGCRVLEVGPASGFLTFKMEQNGAEVIGFDVAPGVSPDVMPMPEAEHEEIKQQFARDTYSVRAAWWFFHRLFASKSRVVYGNIYDMPKDIGTFDVSVLGAVLLHLANPFAALTQVARLTDRTMIISDLYDKRLDGGAFMEINPHRGLAGPMAWWLISPQACVHMLHANGFAVTSLTFHDYNHHPTRDPLVFQTHTFFTIIAERKSGDESLAKMATTVERDNIKKPSAAKRFASRLWRRRQ
jgi:SAM-dependent methyltransferase